MMLQCSHIRFLAILILKVIFNPPSLIGAIIRKAKRININIMWKIISSYAYGYKYPGQARWALINMSEI